MTKLDIENESNIIAEIYALSYIGEYKISAALQFLYLDDYIIHRIELLNNSYDRTITHTLIELTGIGIGDLYYLKNQEFEVSSLSMPQFYSYLAECDVADLLLPKYTFKYDYLLIHKDYIDEFHFKYSSTSSVWGGFKISDNVNHITYYTKSVLSIEIPDELKELDSYAQDSILRALDQRHSFERFLKLYHLLELEFDYSLIKKIKSLNIASDSNMIGILLNDYNRNESDRLFDLISSNCTAINRLALKLNEIKLYQNLGEEIFIQFGKGNKGNMFLSDINKYNTLLADPNSFTDPNAVRTLASIPITDYNKFIHTITAYWIYRIRCSIAHFKIGEFILTKDKEDFIVEFAEPLIKEVLIQFYKK